MWFVVKLVHNGEVDSTWVVGEEQKNKLVADVATLVDQTGGAYSVIVSQGYASRLVATAKGGLMPAIDLTGAVHI